MSRPSVVITTTASVDGKLDVRADGRLLDPEDARRWNLIKTIDTDEVQASRTLEVGATAVLEGSGSFVDPDQPIVLPEVTLSEQDLRRHHVPTRAGRYFVVADSRGRVDWTFTGDEFSTLVVVVCQTTPLGYLQMLHDRGIGYLVAGELQVDVAVTLDLLAELLDVRTVAADSGGTFNAALLAAGVVDELDVILLPGLIGGAGTTTMVDGPGLGKQGLPLQLQLLTHHASASGLIRLRYRVLGPAVNHG